MPPLVYLSHGTPQSTPLEWWLGETPDSSDFTAATSDESKTARVDWVVGACLVVRRAVLQAVGGFDPRFFMYFEETDWCLRIKEAGWEVAYFPDAHVRHHRSKSADQDLIARALNFHLSRHKFLAKERGPLGCPTSAGHHRPHLRCLHGRTRP